MRTRLLTVTVALVPMAAAAGPIGVSITTTNTGYYGSGNAITTTNGASTEISTSGGTGINAYSLQFKSNDTITSDGGFVFTTSLNAVGNVSMQNRTLVTLTITNNGQTAEHLRFDSQILPGHIASDQQPNSQTFNQAEYLFNVYLNGNTANPIYKNYGEATNGASKITGFNILNGASQFFQHHAEQGSVYAADWGATNINLDLGTLAAGASETVTYDQTLFADISSGCFNQGGSFGIKGCSGVSVAFGDPRHSGGVVGTNIAGQGKPGSKPIGFQTNPFDSYFHVVDFSAPLPDAPPPPVIPNYNAAAPVPEPAALALFGLGASALAFARRRRG